MYSTYSSYSPQASAFVSFGYGTSINRYRHFEHAAHAHDHANTPQLSYGISADWMIFKYTIFSTAFCEISAFFAHAGWKFAMFPAVCYIILSTITLKSWNT